MAVTEEIRLATKEMLDRTDVFIITLGLSEVWYDIPTGEVFWRAVPQAFFDVKRHGFRSTTFSENYCNLLNMVWYIRRHRPEAHIIFTLSPIALTATFRPMSCIAANVASKAVLRASVDALMQSYVDRLCDGRLFYFPSYEIVTQCFNFPFMEDRRHVHAHVIEFIMQVFEKYYCGAPLDVYAILSWAQGMDALVAAQGHWSVPRKSLRFAKPGKGYGE
jgi:hypothetical protein